MKLVFCVRKRLVLLLNTIQDSTCPLYENRDNIAHHYFKSIKDKARDISSNGTYGITSLLDERRSTAICQEARHYNLITGYAARRVFTIGGRLLPPCGNILGGIQYCSL